MKQEYQQSRLRSSFRKFYGRYNDLVSKYNLSLTDWRFSYQLLVHYLYTELTTDFFRYFLVMTRSTRRVWPVDSGCSLLHGTWSHLCFGGPCLLCSYFVLFYGLWDWILFVIFISFLFTNVMFWKECLRHLTTIPFWWNTCWCDVAKCAKVIITISLPTYSV